MTAPTGSDLRAWRESHGLTQPQAAPLLGIHERRLRALEAGRSDPLPESVAGALRRLEAQAARPRLAPVVFDAGFTVQDFRRWCDRWAPAARPCYHRPSLTGADP